jgi:hypothetical protein
MLSVMVYVPECHPGHRTVDELATRFAARSVRYSRLSKRRRERRSCRFATSVLTFATSALTLRINSVCWITELFTVRMSALSSPRWVPTRAICDVVACWGAFELPNHNQELGVDRFVWRSGICHFRSRLEAHQTYALMLQAGSCCSDCLAPRYEPFSTLKLLNNPTF